MAHVEVEVPCQVDASSAAEVTPHQLPQVVARRLPFIPFSEPSWSVSYQDGSVVGTHPLLRNPSKVPALAHVDIVNQG